MKQISSSAGSGRYRVELNAFCTQGNGICAFLTGGEKPHMGGSAVAVPRMKSQAENPDDRTTDLWMSSVPGHKDAEIAIHVAKYLAIELNEAISLSAGIHIDHAQKKEIDVLCDNCMEAARELVQRMNKEKSRG